MMPVTRQDVMALINTMLEESWKQGRIDGKDAAQQQITYYRDMWLAQRVENENYRKQLGLVPVSDEAERELNGGKR